MRFAFRSYCLLLVGLGSPGCGAGPGTASEVKAPRASQSPAPSLAHRAAKPAQARKALPASGKSLGSAKPRGNTKKLSALWSNRRAMSCHFQMAVEQGAAKGQVKGKIAWVNPSEQAPLGQISAELVGSLDGKRCSFRVRSVKDALLLERWQPSTQLSQMEQLPSSGIPSQLAPLRQLELPMVQSFLASGCASVFQVPPGQKAMWSLREAGAQRVVWEGPAGASQFLLLDASGTLPKQRGVEFLDSSGAKVRWNLDFDCKSAG